LGAENKNWKGGKTRDSKDGYVFVYLYPDDFFYHMARRGYVREHRLIMAKHLNRCLQNWEVVHHKNGIKNDNRIENLELSTSHSHIKDHNKGYSDGFKKGYLDGRNKHFNELKIQNDELLKEVKLLQWQIKQMAIPNIIPST
jgi:hypothetical protein